MKKDTRLDRMVHTTKNTKFYPPSIEEIISQFNIRGILGDIEPQKFQAHYESNGWFVGRTKMRSWRAAVAGWVLRMNQYNPASSPSQNPQEDYNMFMNMANERSANNG